jgi:osmotically-inducible protein OsmY
VQLINCFPIAVALSFAASASMRLDPAGTSQEPAGARGSDRQIRARIEQRLFWSPLVNDADVRVRVRRGTAVLLGAVKGWDSFGAAIEKAFEGGARQVQVRLTVPGFTWKELRPGTYEARLNKQQLDQRRSSLSDRWLRERIERHMLWSPFVDAQGVTVQVHDGVVVLTGTVDDWSSHGGATENAFEGGAIVVRNLLKIDASK